MKRYILVEPHTSIDVGMPIEKELEALILAIRRCKMERRTVVGTWIINIGVSIEKELEASAVAMPRRKMDWPILIPAGMDIGSSFEKELNTLMVAFR